MERRDLFKAMILAASGCIAAAKVQADEARAMRVVYHLSDPGKGTLVLGNLHNHIQGGPAGVELAAVVHGSALAVFRLTMTKVAMKEDLQRAIKGGVVFYACANTLAAHQWTLADFAGVRSGGKRRRRKTSGFAGAGLGLSAAINGIQFSYGRCRAVGMTSDSERRSRETRPENVLRQASRFPLEAALARCEREGVSEVSRLPSVARSNVSGMARC